MNLNRRIAKSLLVLTIASVFSTAALADTRPDIATQHVATLPAISQQGQQAFMDVVTNNFPGVRVRYQAQVQRAVTCGQICNVGNPDVLRPCRNDLAWTGLD